jgi:hypothetical protein
MTLAAEAPPNGCRVHCSLRGALSIQTEKPFLLYRASGILVGFIVGDIALRKYVTPYLYISWKIENKYGQAGLGVYHVIIKWHGH